MFYPKQTKKPSKTLNPSLMYLIIPKAATFISISTVKIKLNTKLLISTNLDSVSGWLWCSMPILKMLCVSMLLYENTSADLRLFKMMHSLMKCWNLLSFTIELSLEVICWQFCLTYIFMLNRICFKGGFGDGLMILKPSTNRAASFVDKSKQCNVKSYIYTTNVKCLFSFSWTWSLVPKIVFFFIWSWVWHLQKTLPHLQD